MTHYDTVYTNLTTISQSMGAVAAIDKARDILRQESIGNASFDAKRAASAFIERNSNSVKVTKVGIRSTFGKPKPFKQNSKRLQNLQKKWEGIAAVVQPLIDANVDNSVILTVVKGLGFDYQARHIRRMCGRLKTKGTVINAG